MKKKYLAISVLLLGVTLKAQTDSKFSLSGSVDAYFRTNLNGINKVYPDAPNQLIAPPTAYADKTGFALGMANLGGSYEYKNVGAVVDLVVGPRGRETIFNGTGTANIINQAYVYWKTTDKLMFTFGQFNTFLGYEVISPTGNFNYSTSYLFSNSPFNHTGLKANYQFNDKWSAMLSFMNPNDVLESNTAGTYTTGAQIAYTGKQDKFYLNFLYGDQDGKLNKYHNVLGDTSKGTTFQADLTANLSLTDKFYLGINSSYNTSGKGQVFSSNGIENNTSANSPGFYGVALYPQYKFSENSALGLRAEYFKELNGGVSSLTSNNDFNTHALEFTLTGDFKVAGPLSVKPELRYDYASENIYTANSSGKPSNNLMSVALATIYKF
jgi:hypothetical protein